MQALLPGLSMEDVGVRLEEGWLIIEGAVPRREGRYYHTERYSGPFCRKLNLGTEAEKDMRISLEDGILQVILHRGKEA